ncbi:GNAT family N-acetyltransferase [Herbiconiux sp. SYSU D00978]|uniref:GNAT family N-acetyltransferase n=1 Tax=Herbiconiux sp. SYSU D00978 TaxID=2812562 RepID=UPI001A95A5F7|nr:GNAT family N-acetyltransferase [Herbiconiux sp. SYSU D00978]
MLPEVAALYAATFVEPPYLRTPESIRAFTGDTLYRHASYPEYTLVVARDEGGRFAGFAYGYAGARGQYWTNMVTGLVDTGTAEHWNLGRHREVAEVALAPWARGSGLGRRVVTTLMEQAPPGTTHLLSAHEDATPARTLYESLGFQSFARTGSYLIMGRRP